MSLVPWTRCNPCSAGAKQLQRLSSQAAPQPRPPPECVTHIFDVFCPAQTVRRRRSFSVEELVGRIFLLVSFPFFSFLNTLGVAGAGRYALASRSAPLGPVSLSAANSFLLKLHPDVREACVISAHLNLQRVACMRVLNCRCAMASLTQISKQ